MLLASVFGVTNEIFAWLADEVPPELEADAILVRDTMARVGELMVEGLARPDLDTVAAGLDAEFRHFLEHIVSDEADQGMADFLNR